MQSHRTIQGWHGHHPKTRSLTLNQLPLAFRFPRLAATLSRVRNHAAHAEVQLKLIAGRDAASELGSTESFFPGQVGICFIYSLPYEDGLQSQRNECMHKM